MVVRIRVTRKVGYNTKKPAAWNVRHGMSVLRNKYRMKDKGDILLRIERETNARAVQLKNRAPEASMKFEEIRDLAKQERMRVM